MEKEIISPTEPRKVGRITLLLRNRLPYQKKFVPLHKQNE
jgi:hypothetical protein